MEVLAFSGKADQLLETEEERYERMAGEEAARLEARRAAKEQEIYGGMDFKPHLNPRSLRMAKVSMDPLWWLPLRDRPRVQCTSGEHPACARY